MPDQKIDDLPRYKESPLYSAAERAALEWADAMTVSDLETTDEMYQRLRQHYTEDEVIELTAVIALENFRSKFNHALRIPSQELWTRSP